MYILKQYDAQQDKIVIFDSKTRQFNTASFRAVAVQASQGLLKVYGLRTLANCDKTCIRLDAYKIGVCIQDAKLALVEWYVKNGMPRAQAEAKVGYKKEDA